MANTRLTPFTIQASQIPGNLTDVPVLFTRANLSDEMVDPSGGNASRTDGGDIRCYEDITGTPTEIPRHIVHWEHDTTSAAGDALIEGHMLFGDLDAVSGATGEYQYGDGTLTDYGVTDANGRNAVWAGAQMACLMESETPGDSSGNHTLSLAGETPAISAPFGTANSFSGNDRLSNADAALRDLPTGHDFTVSVIALRTSIAQDTATLSWEGTDDLAVYVAEDGFADPSAACRVFWRDLSASASILASAQDTAPANQWNWCDFTTRAADDHELYVAGASADTDASTGTAGPFTAFYIGGFGATSQDYDGGIAQVIVWKTARSGDWITTQYNNQSSPATFIIEGTPEDVSDGALLGTSNLAFAPSAVLSGTGALNGTAALAFSNTGTLSGTGALNGASALTFSPSAVLSAAISSNQNFALLGWLQSWSIPAPVDAGLAQGDKQHLLYGLQSPTWGGGVGALEGTAAVTFTGSAVLTGTGALAGTADLVFAESVTLAGTGALIATAAVQFANTGVLTATGALNGTSALSFAGAAVLKATGALVGTASLDFAGSAEPTVEGGLAGSADLAFAGAAELKGTGALAGTAAVTFAGSAQPTVENALNGTAALSFTGQAAGRLVGVLSGVAVNTFGATGQMAATGSLTGTSAIAFTATDTLSAVGKLIGSSDLVFSTTASLEEPIPPPDQRTISVGARGSTIVVAGRAGIVVPARRGTVAVKQ